MKTARTLQEKLKDLRTARHLTLDELSAETGISSSTLGNYENDENKDISHTYLIILAKYYGVTPNFLLGFSENETMENDSISELNLDDDTIDILKNPTFNSRLLCEMIKHSYFDKFMADLEIYVDDIAGMQIKSLNAFINHAREKLKGNLDVSDSEHYIETLKVAEIDPDEYFGNMLSNDIRYIAKDIREDHKDDEETADKENPINEILNSQKDLFKAPTNNQALLAYYGKVLQMNFNDMTPDELNKFTSYIQKFSKLAKKEKPGRGKKKK